MRWEASFGEAERRHTLDIGFGLVEPGSMAAQFARDYASPRDYWPIPFSLFRLFPFCPVSAAGKLLALG